MSTSQANIWKERFDFIKSNLSFLLVRFDSDDKIKIIENNNLHPNAKEGNSYPIHEIIDSSRTKELDRLINSEYSKTTQYLLIKGGPPLIIHCLTQTICNQKESIWFKEKPENDIQQFTSTATVAHDIRSPINAIIGLSHVIELMQASKEINQNELSKINNLIKKSCQDAIDFTNDILEYSSLQSSTQELERESVGVSSFINHYINTHQLMVMKKRIKISIVKDESENKAIRINKTKITRVLDNIFSNAIKFSAIGSSIDINISSNDGNIKLDIIDHGIGMNKDILSSIFVKFGKSRRKGLSGEKSHGLGMSIIRQIMESHGGSVEVKSEDQVGTIVSLIFN